MTIDVTLADLQKELTRDADRELGNSKIKMIAAKAFMALAATQVRENCPDFTLDDNAELLRFVAGELGLEASIAVRGEKSNRAVGA